MRNFHLPLPDATYTALRAEAKRAKLPATAIAREAISDWLRARRKTVRQKAVTKYATTTAGTQFDMDPTLEAAAIRELIRMPQYKK
jgi:hypothetical protein